ncbi:MAG: DNA mismatch endonuclease Vsr [Pseudomonadota bacterium]
MVDIVSVAVRSRMMGAIGRADTLPEMTVRRFLHAKGFRYRLHVRSLPGRPDLVLPKYKLAVFVHGCFWHRHCDCRYAPVPHENFDFWQLKFDKNVERDQRVLAALIENGWRVLVVWECGLRTALLREKLESLPSLIRNLRLTKIEWPQEPQA